MLDYEEGGENGFVHKLRGRLKYPNLMLKRGVTHEEALLKWLFEPEGRESGTVTVALLGPDAKPVRRWAFAGAFPVKWQGPTLNAGLHERRDRDARDRPPGLRQEGLS